MDKAKNEGFRKVARRKKKHAQSTMALNNESTAMVSDDLLNELALLESEDLDTYSNDQTEDKGKKYESIDETNQ